MNLNDKIRIPIVTLSNSLNIVQVEEIFSKLLPIIEAEILFARADSAKQQYEADLLVQNAEIAKAKEQTAREIFRVIKLHLRYVGAAECGYYTISSSEWIELESRFIKEK
jgi:hypothetical protein